MLFFVLLNIRFG